MNVARRREGQFFLSNQSSKYLTFSPLCIRQCVFNDDEVENALPHVGHTCGFSPTSDTSITFGDE